MLSIRSVGLQAGILLLFVPGIVLGGWQECPANITVYTGCYTTVFALYTTNDSSDCTTTGYKYYVYIRSSELNNIDDYKPFGDITVTVVDNSNSTTCNITTTGLVDKSPGLYDLMLQFVPNPNNPLENQECHDKLFVEETIPSPTITGSKVTCEGIHLEWEGPVLASGFTVLGYTLTVLGPSFIYELKTDTITSQLIPYSAGLEWCTVSVAAIYCGGTGNSTNETLYAAIVEPVMKVVNVEDPVVFYKNATSCSLFFEFEIDCEVSHPKSATIITNCTSSVTRHRWNSTTPPHPVSIRHDGSIIVDSTVPLNHQCDVRIIFNNGDLSTPIDTSVNTNELDSCSFIVNGSTLAFLCVFSQFSSLEGCRVQLTLLTDTVTVCPHTMSNSTIDMTSNQTYGVINDLCNGLYSARCLGLAMIDPSSTAEDSHSLVPYDPAHTTTVTVTAGVTSCTISNTVTVTAAGVTSCTISNTVLSTSIPPNGVVCQQETLNVIVALCVVILVLLIGLAIGFLFMCIYYFRTHKQSYSTKTTTDKCEHSSGHVETNSHRRSGSPSCSVDPQLRRAIYKSENSPEPSTKTTNLPGIPGDEELADEFLARPQPSTNDVTNKPKSHVVTSKSNNPLQATSGYHDTDSKTKPKFPSNKSEVQLQSNDGRPSLPSEESGNNANAKIQVHGSQDNDLQSLPESDERKKLAS